MSSQSTSIDPQTYDRFFQAVSNRGSDLQYVPKELKCNEIVLAAVKQDGQALQYASEETLNKKIVLVAVNNGFCLKRLDSEIKYIESTLEEGEIHEYYEDLKSNYEEIRLILEEYRKDLETELSKVERVINPPIWRGYAVGHF